MLRSYAGAAPFVWTYTYSCEVSSPGVSPCVQIVVLNVDYLAVLQCHLNYRDHINTFVTEIACIRTAQLPVLQSPGRLAERHHGDEVRCLHGKCRFSNDLDLSKVVCSSCDTEFSVPLLTCTISAFVSVHLTSRQCSLAPGDTTSNVTTDQRRVNPSP